MSLGTPERRWPKNTKPVWASARKGFRKFETASKAKRNAHTVRNQPRFRSIGFLHRRDVFDGGHLPAAVSPVQIDFRGKELYSRLPAKTRSGRAGMIFLRRRCPKQRVLTQGLSSSYPDRAKLFCKLRAGVEIIHSLFRIARREAKDQMFKPKPEKSL